ncbi:hypothetical protein [Alloscardovia omnicolens]|uniref:hypothetical protein n=1 Tax=Alloscardovia omnicolens TaxID=419015 RepID=UPI00066937F3|nr:hypothetical protein [Alloscardovia omnicolens]
MDKQTGEWGYAGLVIPWNATYDSDLNPQAKMLYAHLLKMNRCGVVDLPPEHNLIQLLSMPPSQVKQALDTLTTLGYVRLFKHGERTFFTARRPLTAIKEQSYETV